MRLSLKLLKQYCPTDLGPREIAERLTRAGLEVEEIIELDGDTALEAEVTSNRPDWNNHIGVARDLAAAVGAQLVIPDVSFGEVAPPSAELTSVTIDDFVGCPCYTARMISGVEIAPSPEWLRQVIEAVGLRPINNVVDITNFVLFECGQPLHAFDFDKLEEGRIVVRRAKSGELITSIDERDHELCSADLVIADGKHPVAIAGVMGGLDTEIAERTKTILLESAFFDPMTVKATSRRLDLLSDASFRFERRVDPSKVDWASNRAAALIADIAGGKIHEGLIDVTKMDLSMPKVSLRYDRVYRLLGMRVDPDQIRRILSSLGFAILYEDEDFVTVRVPPYRADVTMEADLIEEVARLVGYDNIEAAPTMRIRPGHMPPAMNATNRAAEILCSCGYLEGVTFSFASEEETERYTPWGGNGVLKTRTTVRAECNSLRKTLMPSLLESFRLNRRRGNRGVKLFEIARVFLPTESSLLPHEKTVVAMVDGDGFRSAKGAVQVLFDRFGLQNVDTVREDRRIFEKGAALSFKAEGKLLGVIGKLSTAEAEGLDMTDQPALAEIDFDLVMHLANPEKRYKPVPATPASRRDLAIVVDIGIDWAEVEGSIFECAPDILESLEFFDDYRGSQVPKGTKSLAFSMCLRHPARTLSSEEVEEGVQRILKHLEAKLGATLRSK